MDWKRLFDRLSSPAESESDTPPSTRMLDLPPFLTEGESPSGELDSSDSGGNRAFPEFQRRVTPLDVLHLLSHYPRWHEGFLVEGLATRLQGAYSPIQEWNLLRYGSHVHEVWCPVCGDLRRGFTRGFAYSIGETLIPNCHHGQYLAGGNHTVYWLSPESLIDCIAWIRAVEQTAPGPEGYRSIAQWVDQLPPLNHAPVPVTWSLTEIQTPQEEEVTR